MAKKQQRQEKQENKSSKPVFTEELINLLAFLALAAAAVLLLIGPILGWILEQTGGTVIMQALSLVAQYCLLAAIAIPGWRFVRGRGKGWKIAYFIFLAVYIAGTILGVTVGI